MTYTQLPGRFAGSPCSTCLSSKNFTAATYRAGLVRCMRACSRLITHGQTALPLNAALQQQYRLLLGTMAMMMTPNGIDFSDLFSEHGRLQVGNTHDGGVMTAAAVERSFMATHHFVQSFQTAQCNIHQIVASMLTVYRKQMRFMPQAARCIGTFF